VECVCAYVCGVRVFVCVCVQHLYLYVWGIAECMRSVCVCVRTWSVCSACMFVHVLNERLCVCVCGGCACVCVCVISKYVCMCVECVCA